MGDAIRGQARRWSCAISTRCSPSPRKGRSRPPPTRSHTVQSNVSDQVRQLEAELGVPLLVRSRQGAEPTEFGVLVLERARRVRARARGDARRPRDAAGARSGATRAWAWSAPRAVGSSPRSSPTCATARRVCACASTRARRSGCSPSCVEGELAQAVVTEPVNDRRLVVEHLLDEDARRASSARDVELPTRAGAARGVRRAPARAPARAQPAAHRARACRRGRRAHADRPGRGRGHPPHRRPRGRGRLRVDPARRPRSRPISRPCAIVTIAKMPPRRLAIVSARDVQLSLADQAVRESVDRSVVDTHMSARAEAGEASTVTHEEGVGQVEGTGHTDESTSQGQREADRARPARRAPRAVRSC